MNEIKAVVFDIDDTLSPGNSWVSTSIALGASVDEHLSIYQKHKDGLIDGESSAAELVELWRATGNATKLFLQNAFDELPLFDGSTEVIQTVRERYGRVCLITGSMDLFAATVARRLDLTEWYANGQLLWDNNDNLVGLTYQLDQRALKLGQFTAFCRKHNLAATDCVVVGDGDNDVSLFEATGRGVAIGDHVPSALAEVAWKSTIDVKSLIDIL